MKRELQIFLTAVMFYTRIPVPGWINHDETFITLSTRYLPLIGWIVGSVYACVMILAGLLFSPLTSIVIGMIASVLLTGAFHEDGFADMCDGFGGGWTKEKILLIMKDSRVGTYGIVGLMLLVALKISVTNELFHIDKISFFLIIISSHAISRMMPVIVIARIHYARDDGDGKVKPVAKGVSTISFLIATLWAIIPMIILVCRSSFILLTGIVPVLVATALLIRYFKKWIGGYTGDCLGATQQITEVVFLISTFLLWRSI